MKAKASMHEFSFNATTELTPRHRPRSRLRGYFCLLIAAIGISGVSLAPLDAAEISAISSVRVVLEGEIQSGDYDKLRNLIDPNTDVSVGVGGLGGDWYGDTYQQIYLASPGGNVAEAMKIGRLLRALRWDAVVPSPITNPYIIPEKVFADNQLKDPKANYMCVSACFFIFVAGIYRISEPLGEENPLLGVHRPFLTDTDLRKMSGGQAIASANQARAVVETYLKEMGVPMRYADLMFSIPKDEVRWIDNADFEADFEDIIPELKDWLDAKCDKRTDVEKALWKIIMKKSNSEMTTPERSIANMLLKKMDAQSRCELSARTRLHKDAWSQMFKPNGASSSTSWWGRIWQAFGMHGDR